MGVFLIASLVAVGGVIVAHTTIDEEPVNIDIIVDGEGTVEPIPGLYSIEKGNELTLNMKAADGWLLSMVTIDGKDILFGEKEASLTITMDSDKVVVVHFISPEVIIPESGSFVFNGEEIVAYEDNSLYVVENGSAVDAGTYDATLSLRYPDFSHWSDGSVEDKVVTWNINPKQISVSDFRDIDDRIYEGKQIMPTLVPIAPLTVDDYSFTYGDNKDAGVGTVDVVARNNFVGSLTLEFDILKKDLKLIVHDANTTYGGAAPAYDYHFDGFVDGEDASVLGGTLSIVCDYPGINGDAGEYPIVASGLTSDNYDIEYLNGKFTVSPYQLKADDFTIDLSDEMYDASEHIKDVDAKPVFIDESSDIIVEHRNNIDASTPNGKAQIVIKGDGKNCVGTVTKEFTITKRDVTFTSPSGSYVYNGQAHTFDADDIVISGTGLVEGHDVVFSDFISETVVGTYTNSFGYAFVPATVADNYSVTTNYGTLSITAVQEPIVITANSASKKYDGKELTDTGFELTSGSLIVGDRLVVVVTGSITDFGSVDNKVSSVKVMRGDLDVTGSYVFGTHVNGKLEITKRPVTLTSESASKFYDGTPLIDHNVIIGGDRFVDGEGATYAFDNVSTVTFFKDSPVQNKFTYSLKDGTKASNYDISVIYGELRIDKVPSTLSIISGSKEKVYDGTPLEFKEYSKSSSVLIAGDVLTVTFTGKVTDVTDTPVDNEFTYVIKRGDVDVTDCYNVEAVFGKLNVTPYTLVPTDFTIDLGSEEYDGDVQQKVVTSNKSFLIEGTTYSVTYSNNILPGTAIITVAGISPNCEGTVIYEFTVDRRSVDLTAGSDSKTYDGSKLECSTYVGGTLLDGDIWSDVVVEGSQTDAGSSANRIMGYKIVRNGQDVTSYYDVNTVDGTLTVNPKSVTVKANDASKVYGDTDPVLSAAVTGLIPGESEGLIGYTLHREAGEVVRDGGYTITPIGDELQGNYEVTFENGTFTITARSIVFTGESATVSYNGDEQSINGILVDNILPGHNYEGVTYVAKGIDVGTYTGSFDHNNLKVLYGTVDVTSNYAPSYVPGKLTIVKAGISVPADIKGLVYDGTVQTGVADGVGYTLTGNTAKDAGDHTATASLVEGYIWSDGTSENKIVPWSIAKRNVTLTSDASTRAYDSTPLSDHDVLAEGFVDGEGVFSYDSFLSITDVGKISNTFTYVLKENTKAGNYSIAQSYGVLEVTPASLKVITGDAEKIYDGTPLTNADCSVDGLKNDETVTLRTVGTITDVGSEQNGYTLTFDGTAKEANYSVTEESLGTLTVKKATLTVVTQSAKKIYDGIELVAPGSISGFVTGESATFTVTGAVTDVGEDNNTYSITWDGTAKQGNYEISETIGVLTVDPRPLSVSDFNSIAPIQYTGSGITPSVTSKNSLVTSSDYYVSYSDNVSVGTATVTVTGKANATGTVGLSFDIYAGLDVGVYGVTRNGQTTDYNGQGLSTFGKDGNAPLFHMNGILPGTVQMAQMKAKINGQYEGMWLGIAIGNADGKTIDQTNALLDALCLRIECGNSTKTVSLREAYSGVADIAVVGNVSEMDLTVSLMFPSEGNQNHLQGLTLDFKLVMCLMPPSNQ